MAEDNVAIRLKHFLSESNMSPSVFADTCGIPRPTLSQLLNGRNKKISDVLIGLIHKAFPSLSVMWLLFGEGSMFERLPKDDGLSTFAGEVDFSNPSILAENQIFSTNGGVDSEYLKEIAVSSASGMRKASDNQLVNVGLGAVDQRFQSDSNKVKPRSVIRITVFYDDNSYETFEKDSKKD